MKIRLSPYLAAAAAVAVVSCAKQPAGPEFGIAATDTLIHRNGISCKVEYRFASILNAADSPALTAIEQANLGYFFGLEAFSGTVREAAATAVEQIADIYLADSLPAGCGNTEYEISAESEGAVVDTLVTYTVTTSSYTGGAHGMYSRENYVYSLEGGYEITLYDLFTAAQQENLDRLIRRKLYGQYGVLDDEGLAAAGFFPEYIASTDNFRVTPEGIVFSYNPYEIAYYGLGCIEVEVTREELAGL